MADDGPIYFWRDWAPGGFLSQWYLAPFRNLDDPEHQQQNFNCCEQWMMYNKALLIATPGPPEAIGKGKHSVSSALPQLEVSEERRALPAQVMSEEVPAKQKFLTRGPAVRFEKWQEKKWDAIKLGIVTQGNYYKFSQNPDLKKLLLETADRELIEAAPNDKIWGIGFEASDAKKHVHRRDWGRNLLGIALMNVRARLRSEVLRRDD